MTELEMQILATFAGPAIGGLLVWLYFRFWDNE